MRLKLLSLFVMLICTHSIWAQAQHRITTSEEKLFKRKALEKIEELEYMYNQLLEAPSYEREDIIKNVTISSSEFYPLFKDDQIQVEDDFRTRATTTNKADFKRIDSYLNDICLYYGKSDNGVFKNANKKIKLINAVAKVMAAPSKTFMFVKVSFQVDYNGFDSRTNQPFKKPCNRVAEIHVEKINGTWQFTIDALRFFTDNEKDYSANVIIEKNSTDKPDTETEKVVVEEKKKTLIKNSKVVLLGFKANEKWGVRDAETAKVIAKPAFDEIEEFSEDELAMVNIDGYWGYIGIDGNIIIKCEYDNAEAFSKEKKGRARVYKGMESFLIDKNGNKVK